MKSRFPLVTAVLVALLVVGSAHAMKIEPPPMPAERGSLYSTAPSRDGGATSLRPGDFSVNLVITESPNGLRKWLAMSDEEREKKIAKPKFRPNQKGYLVLVLTNYDLGQNGSIDLTAQLTLIDPDGKVVYEHRDLGKSAWGHPMQGYLAIKPQVDFSFDSDDRPGTYTYRVTVSDHLKREAVSAEGTVLLVK